MDIWSSVDHCLNNNEIVLMMSQPNSHAQQIVQYSYYISFCYKMLCRFVRNNTCSALNGVSLHLDVLLMCTSSFLLPLNSMPTSGV
jgi:hypothetical protein